MPPLYSTQRKVLCFVLEIVRLPFRVTLPAKIVLQKQSLQTHPPPSPSPISRSNAFNTKHSGRSGGISSTACRIRCTASAPFATPMAMSTGSGGWLGVRPSSALMMGTCSGVGIISG
eukprot:363740-Chlamydomonas_euryale.AAC.12